MNKNKIRLSNLIILTASYALLANPVIWEMTHYGPVDSRSNWKYWLIILALIIPIIILEWIFLLRIFEISREKRRRFLFLICKVHLLTYPLTVLLGIIFSFFAEIVPIILEPILYKKWLEGKNISTSGLILGVLIANFISFVAGTIIFYSIKWMLLPIFYGG